MSRLSLSRVSSSLLPHSFSRGSSFSPARFIFSPFVNSGDRSPISSFLHPSPSHRPYLTGSTQLSKKISGDFENVGRQIVGRACKALGALGPGWGLARTRDAATIPYAMVPKSFLHEDSRRKFDSLRNLRSMNFVKGILEEDGKDFTSASQFHRPNVEQNADIVHVKLMRNNTFMTVTDNKGNTKLKASAGRLEELKGGPKLSRYAAEAVAEYVGRESRKLGLKSVVMRVKGFTYFKKKKQAILNWRDGFTDSRSDQNPIVYIEDITRRPHNGCRLPKKRRV